jgi:hypothetical protein
MGMSATVARVAGEYYAATRAFQARRSTAEQYRAENRRLRGTCSEEQWQQAKLAAFASMDKNGG